MHGQLSLNGDNSLCVVVVVFFVFFARVKKERSFLWNLMQQFLSVLADIPGEGMVIFPTLDYSD